MYPDVSVGEGDGLDTDTGLFRAFTEVAGVRQSSPGMVFGCVTGNPLYFFFRGRRSF